MSNAVLQPMKVDNLFSKCGESDGPEPKSIGIFAGFPVMLTGLMLMVLPAEAESVQVDSPFQLVGVGLMSVGLALIGSFRAAPYLVSLICIMCPIGALVYACGYPLRQARYYKNGKFADYVAGLYLMVGITIATVCGIALCRTQSSSIWVVLTLYSVAFGGTASLGGLAAFIIPTKRSRSESKTSPAALSATTALCAPATSNFEEVASDFKVKLDDFAATRNAQSQRFIGNLISVVGVICLFVPVVFSDYLQILTRFSELVVTTIGLDSNSPLYPIVTCVSTILPLILPTIVCIFIGSKIKRPIDNGFSIFDASLASMTAFQQKTFERHVAELRNYGYEVVTYAKTVMSAERAVCLLIHEDRKSMVEIAIGQQTSLSAMSIVSDGTLVCVGSFQPAFTIEPGQFKSPIICKYAPNISIAQMSNFLANVAHEFAVRGKQAVTIQPESVYQVIYYEYILVTNCEFEGKHRVLPPRCPVPPRNEVIQCCNGKYTFHFRSLASVTPNFRQS